MSFLGVEKSVMGKRWIARAFDERTAEALVQRHNMPGILARCLVARGVGMDEAAFFLDPKLRDLLPNPSLFQDMDKAAARMVRAVQDGEKITVFGDYDVDGATSSALLVRFTRSLGVDIDLYIPDREKEGYGPNSVAMQKLAAEGTSLTICVDCGTTAYEPLAAAKEAGMDVIVLDHHTAEPDLPDAVAVVNPNRLDDPQGEKYGNMAAVGVTYLFIIAVNRALRDAGFYTDKNAEPDLKNLLDLVALGTVCDVMTLIGLNRAFVTQGLKIMETEQNVGIKALLDVVASDGKGEGKKPSKLDAFTLGFVLGPRINAAGRIGDSSLGSRLLSMEDPQLAVGYAEKLHNLNKERREMEAEILRSTERMDINGDDPLILVADEGWHPGVIGIIASRLKEKYNRPAIVISLEGDIGKGSGRSVGTIDLGTLVLAARQKGLLIGGGGHKMAAGLTVARDKIDALKSFLSERIAKEIAREPLVPTLHLDGMIAGTALDQQLLDDLDHMAPFGVGNPEPRFALADCRLTFVKTVGADNNHISFTVMSGGVAVRGIAFRAMDSDLGAALLNLQGKTCHVAGTIRSNTYQGKITPQLFLDDVAPA